MKIQLMRQLLSNYLHHYYHLSLSTCLLTAVTYLSAGNIIDWKYAVWTGLVTFLVYNYHSVLYTNIKDVNNFLKANVSFFCLILISGIVGLILLPKGLYPLVSFLISLIICLLYFRADIVNLKPGRDHFFFKPLMIGLVFGILTALIPYLQSGYSIYESLQLTLGRVAFVMVLAIIFDIGQASEDKLSKEPTMPQKIGIFRTKIIATLLLSMAALSEGYGAWIFLIEFPLFMVFVITWIFTFLLILFAGPNKPSWYYFFLVDGLMLLPWLLTQI